MLHLSIASKIYATSLNDKSILIFSSYNYFRLIASAKVKILTTCLKKAHSGALISDDPCETSGAMPPRIAPHLLAGLPADGFESVAMVIC